MKRWGVLISGRGSNLGALIDARAQNLDLRIVLSSSADAAGLLRARRAGITAELVPFREGTNKIDWAGARSAFDRSRCDSRILSRIYEDRTGFVYSEMAWTDCEFTSVIVARVSGPTQY